MRPCVPATHKRVRCKESHTDNTGPLIPNGEIKEGSSTQIIYYTLENIPDELTTNRQQWHIKRVEEWEWFAL